MTQSKQKLIDAVTASGEKVYNLDSLIISYSEGDAVANVYHDEKMYGNAKINLADIDETELAEDGVKIWRTWEWHS